MSGKAGELAKGRVEESDRGGLQFNRYMPFPSDRRGSNSGKSGAPGTYLPEPELASPEP
jgi:hypothetical protein